MLNMYMITRLDRFTAGVANRDLKAEQRTPGYFITAPSQEAAIEKFLKRLEQVVEVEAELLKKNVAPLF